MACTRCSMVANVPGVALRIRSDESVALDCSCADESQDDSTLYLQDPELLFDVLPQPYRMINKILDLICDRAWEVLAIWIVEQEKEAARFKPPKCRSSEPLPVGCCIYYVSIDYMSWHVI